MRVDRIVGRGGEEEVGDEDEEEVEVGKGKERR